MRRILYLLVFLLPFISCQKNLPGGVGNNMPVIAPERAAAPFANMFIDIGRPAKLYSTPDDWEFLMAMFCNDLEGADALIADTGYNWFSVCGEYSSSLHPWGIE